jgi:diguanylate cyclase (GGDEF)-like protein
MSTILGLPPQEGPARDSYGSLASLIAASYQGRITELEAEASAAHVEAAQAYDREQIALYRADHDSLTTLYKPDVFHTMLTDTLREGHAVTTGFIDLDHFKQINDRLGHEVGDVVLRSVGFGLQTGLRRNVDTKSRIIPVTPGLYSAARQGGDEFTVFTAHDSDQAHNRRNGTLAQKQTRFGTHVRGILAREFEILPTMIHDQVPRVSEAEVRAIGLEASLGFASIGGGHKKDPDTIAVSLLREADAAMYAEKNSKTWSR